MAVTLLHMLWRKSAEKVPPLGKFVNKVAEFGGFLARNADGMPGPQAIWQGMARMRDFTLAWQIYVIVPATA